MIENPIENTAKTKSPEIGKEKPVPGIKPGHVKLSDNRLHRKNNPKDPSLEKIDHREVKNLKQAIGFAPLVIPAIAMEKVARQYPSFLQKQEDKRRMALKQNDEASHQSQLAAEKLTLERIAKLEQRNKSTHSNSLNSISDSSNEASNFRGESFDYLS